MTLDFNLKRSNLINQFSKTNWLILEMMLQMKYRI